jgi:hypothetical protein
MMSREEELELARILLSLTETPVSNHRVTRSMAHNHNEDDDEVSSAGGECDSDSEGDDIYGADLDDDGDEDYAPSDEEESVDDDEESIKDEEEEEEDEDDEDYIPSDGEESVEEQEDEEEDDEDYVPEEDTDEMEQLVRDACSSLARRTKLPSGFRRVLDEARAGNLPAHFVEWMNTIPPISRMLNH